MSARRRSRALLVLLLGLAAVGLPVVVAGPAQAGQVGVTIGIRGSGEVRVVEGSLEDDGSTVCDQWENLDDRQTRWCPRIRNSEVFEAWVWLEAFPRNAPAEWTFVRWEGCDDTRVRNDKVQCAVRSGAFTSDERSPVAVFRDDVAPAAPTLTAAQVPDSPGGFRFEFASPGNALECRRTGAATFTSCTSPLTVNLTEGRHVQEVRAADPSGNTGPAASVTVDSVDTWLVRGPAAWSHDRDPVIAASSGTGDSFECSVGGSAWSWCGNGRDLTHTLHDLADGPHRIAVRARRGTFVDTRPLQVSWNVDTVAPTISLDRAATQGGSATFEFSGSPDIYWFQCRLTGPSIQSSGWNPCTSGASLDGLTDGDYTFELSARDLAGNEQAGAPILHRWTVDRATPETRLTGGPAEGAYLLGPATRFVVSSTEPGTASCRLDGRVRPCQPGALALGGLGAGTHVLTAAATDASGNTDASPARRTFTVPLGAAQLTRSAGWSTVRSPRSYGGRQLVSSRPGASLSRDVRGARRVALVVGTGPGRGTVRVYAGSRLLRTVRLGAARATTRRVVPVATFPAGFTGRLRVVVVGSGRPVHVEGLGVVIP